MLFFRSIHHVSGRKYNEMFSISQIKQGFYTVPFAYAEEFTYFCVIFKTRRK